MVLDDTAHGDPLGTVKSRLMVTQVVSPRLLIVSAEDDPTSILSALPGVRAVYGDKAPREAIESLTAEEALFAEGWNLRRAQPPKERPGEGLGWDAKGFEPPDSPK